MGVGRGSEGGGGGGGGGAGGIVSVAPAVFFMEAPLSDTWVVRGRAAAWKMAPESRSAPVRARGVGFKAPFYHLNAEAASRGVRRRVGFYFRAGFGFPLELLRYPLTLSLSSSDSPILCSSGLQGRPAGWPRYMLHFA